jgi:hypothetical protein
MQWKRIILGDNWRELLVWKNFVFPRDLDRVRDVALVWPLILFSLAGLIHLLQPKTNLDTKIGLELLGCAILTVLAAKEKYMLVGATFVCCAFRLLVVVFLVHDWRAIGAFSVCVVVPAVMFWKRGDYKPSYTIDDGLSFLDIVTGISALMISLLIIQRISAA